MKTFTVTVNEVKRAQALATIRHIMKTPAMNVMLDPLKRARTTNAMAAGRLLLLTVILSLNDLEARADDLVQSFPIKEFFGVSHPKQILISISPVPWIGPRLT